MTAPSQTTAAAATPQPHLSPSAARHPTDPAQQLDQIATAWPEGSLVEHRHCRWTGRITPDPEVDLPAARIHHRHAHGLLPSGPDGRPNGLVCVVWDRAYDPSGLPAWMRTSVLRSATDRRPGRSLRRAKGTPR